MRFILKWYFSGSSFSFFWYCTPWALAVFVYSLSASRVLIKWSYNMNIIFSHKVVKRSCNKILCFSGSVSYERNLGTRIRKVAKNILYVWVICPVAAHPLRLVSRQRFFTQKLAPLSRERPLGRHPCFPASRKLQESSGCFFVTTLHLFFPGELVHYLSLLLV